MSLEEELQKIYDSEINISIDWFWDGGINLKLGDDANGIKASETIGYVSDIVPWFKLVIKKYYPNSTYTKNL